MGIQAELFTCTLPWVSKRNPWICIHNVSWPLRFEPLGMLAVADTVVPLAPITSRGSVMVVGGGLLFELGVRVMVALAVLLASTMLAAFSVIVSWLVTLPGAV